MFLSALLVKNATSEISVFTRESSYCFQRVLAVAILFVCSFVRSSVCPSVTRVNQAKTVQARITKSSSSAAWKTLLSGTEKLFHKFKGVTPNDGAKWEEEERRTRFRIDRGSLRGSSSPLQRFEPARAKPARWHTCPHSVTHCSTTPN